MPTKVHIVKAICGFSSSHVWMWELDHKEGWGPTNLCFWTVCWRRLLRVPWTARRSNQSILKEISPRYSLEGLMLHWSSYTLVTWFEEDSMLGKIEGRRRRRWQRMRWLDGITTQWTWVWTHSGRWCRTGKPAVLQSTGSQSQTRLSDWTAATEILKWWCLATLHNLVLCSQQIQCLFKTPGPKIHNQVTQKCCFCHPFSNRWLNLVN